MKTETIEFKTPKGTVLPLMILKGKPYLQVAHRIAWFREEHPDWTILTARVEATDKFVIFKAEVKDITGRIHATGHKREDFAHFADANEKAETGAIGRALALCGYGTQFAPELDEGERLLDAPITPIKPVRQQTMLSSLPKPIDAAIADARAKGIEIKQITPGLGLTDKQRGLLWKLAHDLGYDDDGCRELLSKLNNKHSSKWTRDDFELVLAELHAMKEAKTEELLAEPSNQGDAFEPTDVLA